MLSLFNTAIAEDLNTVDYIDIKKGEVAQFDGKLFKEEAIAKILANHSAEKEELKVEAQYVLDRTKIDLNLKYDVLESKHKSEIEMYKSMIKTRDEYIKDAGKKDILQKWAVYGGFILGAASSIAIFHSVNYD